MAAGQGFKTFVTGEVLTAGDVNGYLMQGINVFTNATARDAAITAPAEGQFAFTKDNNSLWYYDGATWVASGATGDIEGVTAGVGISGGGTSGTVTITNSMATAIDAKGDLVPGTGADTFSRLAVGANGTVLTADSAEATGLKWATPSAGGLTVITSFTANNTVGTYTVSSIPATYKHIMIVGQGLKASVSAYREIGLRFNGDTGANYSYGWIMNSNGTVTGHSFLASANALVVGLSPVTSSATTSLGQFATTIPLYAGSNYKSVNSQWSMGDNDPTGIKQAAGSGTWANTAAITSIEIRQNTGNFNTGTITVYGVS